MREKRPNGDVFRGFVVNGTSTTFFPYWELPACSNVGDIQLPDVPCTECEAKSLKVSSKSVFDTTLLRQRLPLPIRANSLLSN